MLFNLNVFQASYFVPLLGSLVLERLLLALLELIVAHLLLSLQVLLRLQLLEELAVSDENTVWVSLLLSAPGLQFCLLYTSPSPRDRTRSRMPSSA